MLANNNKKIIRRMAVSRLKSNRKRTAVMLLAIALAAFMLCTVFTVGVTYFKMFHIQNLRLNGADFDAVVYGHTLKQEEIFKTNPDILRAGAIVIGGTVIETEADQTLETACIWADETYWEDMCAPARNWVKGSYPKKENEVMVTKEALEKLGFAGLEIGDTFPAVYMDSHGKESQIEFKISGMWEGYGDTESLYVSKEFFEGAGGNFSDISEGRWRYFLDFKQKIMMSGEQEDFIESLDLEKQQACYFVAEIGYSVPILCGMICLVFVTCLSAWLLIYNILYLSVTGNIRYYGLLQTVGMSGKQVFKLVTGQMWILGGIGLLTGLASGSAVSFLLIPSVIKALGISAGVTGGVQVKLHPAVFILTAALIGATVCLGSRKPAKMAVQITPVEALGYRALTLRNGVRKNRKGTVMWRLAREQVKKNRKKSAVIMLSLGAGLSVFLCIVTLLSSQGARTIVGNYMSADMVLENETLSITNPEKQNGEVLPEELVKSFQESDKFTDVYSMKAAEILVPWEEKFADKWMAEAYDMWMEKTYAEDLEDYKAHPEKFSSSMISVNEKELDYLLENTDLKLDKEAFLKGETCILYRNGLDFSNDDLKGDTVACVKGGEEDKTVRFQIAGLTDENYYIGPVLGLTPTVIVSESAMEAFAPEAPVFKISLRYAKEYDEETEAYVERQIEKTGYEKDIDTTSKIQEAERVEAAQGNMKLVGMGVVLILALISLLNYVNTVTGNIQSRYQELTIMESLGMTERQMDAMLMREGLLLAGGSLLFTLTVGMGVTYFVYQSMNYMLAPFTVPVLPVLTAVLFVAAICFTVPVIVRRAMTGRASVAERMKTAE